MRTRSLLASRSAGQGILVGMLAALLSLPTPVQADPPAHAPAHGWRKKHDPYYLGYTGRQWSRDYGILGGRCDREVVGAVLGGVLGGAVGSQVGDGEPNRKGLIGYLDQDPRFHGWMRGRELLSLVGELYGLRGAELRRRIDETLEVVGLGDAGRRAIGGYSGGMRQRLGLAQAILKSRPAKAAPFLRSCIPASPAQPRSRSSVLPPCASSVPCSSSTRASAVAVVRPTCTISAVQRTGPVAVVSGRTKLARVSSVV